MGSREALGVTVSRMTAAIVVQCLWAQLRQVCIAGTDGGVRKTCGFCERNNKLNHGDQKWKNCLQDTSEACIIHYTSTRLTSQ